MNLMLEIELKSEKQRLDTKCFVTNNRYFRDFNMYLNVKIFNKTNNFEDR